MSSLVSHHELVNLLRGHLKSGPSNLLITGVSEIQHSFQIGIKQREIVLLTYRVFKGAKALEKFPFINSAKIIEHFDTEISTVQHDLPDTNTILTHISLLQDKKEGSDNDTRTTQTKTEVVLEKNTHKDSALSSGQQTVNSKQVAAIKASATHYFGPIGALICEDHLTLTNLSNVDLHILLKRITKDVGASDEDTEAFINSIPF